MELLPVLSALNDYVRPTKIFDQHFGVGLDEEDLLSPFILSHYPKRKLRRVLSCPYYRPWNTRNALKDEGSTVKHEKDKFQVNLDVQQFSPDEITVKATGDNTITVEGKHEEKEDEHGYISRHFVRRYTLPKGHDISKTVSKLSSDGILTITAPKESLEKINHIEIPVIQTGMPLKTIENTKNDDKMECENGIANQETPSRKKKQK